MKHTFAQLKLIKKAVSELFAHSRSESESAEAGILLSQVEGEIASRERCTQCENRFSKLDKKTTNSRPHGICVACFTNNA
jgi:hypothetical protein